MNEMHIHPSSPNSSSQSEDDAATKIQAGFRGYRVRKQMRQGKPGSSGNAGSGSGAAGSSGPTAKVGKKQQLGVNLEEKSATKIQAGVRGFLVRKRQKTASEAATKIQASFRGFKTRKELKSTSKKDK